MADSVLNRPDRKLATKRARVAAYAAAGWAFVFAAVSFYWALGGMTGANTLGEGMAALARERDAQIIGLTWITGFLKVAAGLVALGLVQRWGSAFPRWLLLMGAWAASVIFVVYAGANFIQHGLMVAGQRPIPDLIGTMEAARWHLFFWDPFWLVGGLLFGLAAWYAGLATRRAEA